MYDVYQRYFQRLFRWKYSMKALVHVVVSGPGPDTVSGRTTCAPSNEWPSVARVLTSVAHRLSFTVSCFKGCQRVDMDLHACGRVSASPSAFDFKDLTNFNQILDHLV